MPKFKPKKSKYINPWWLLHITTQRHVLSWRSFPIFLSFEVQFKAAVCCHVVASKRFYLLRSWQQSLHRAARDNHSARNIITREEKLSGFIFSSAQAGDSWALRKQADTQFVREAAAKDVFYVWICFTAGIEMRLIGQLITGKVISCRALKVCVAYCLTGNAGFCFNERRLCSTSLTKGSFVHYFPFKEIKNCVSCLLFFLLLAPFCSSIFPDLY